MKKTPMKRLLALLLSISIILSLVTVMSVSAATDALVDVDFTADGKINVASSLGTVTAKEYDKAGNAANNPIKGVGTQTVKIGSDEYIVNGAKSTTNTAYIELDTSSYKTALISEMSDGFSVEAGFVLPATIDNTLERYIFGGTSGGGFGLRVAKTSGNLEFIIRCDGSTYDTLSLGAVSANEYHHVVATFDKTAQTVTVYLDGTLTQTKASVTKFNPGTWNGKIMLFDTSSTTSTKQYNLPQGTIVTDFHLYADPLAAADSEAKYTAAVAAMNRSVVDVDFTADGKINVASTLGTLTASEYDKTGNTANNPTKGVGKQIVTVGDKQYTVNGATPTTATGNIGINTGTYKAALISEMADGFSVEAGIVLPATIDTSRERYIFGGTSGGGFGLRVSKTGNLEFILSCTKNYNTLSFGQVSANEYHHVVATYDKTAQTITAYLDGVAATSLTGMTQFNAGSWNGNIMLFDTSSTSSTYQYNLPQGTIVTDFHLYADPLSAEESIAQYAVALKGMSSYENRSVVDVDFTADGKINVASTLGTVTAKELDAAGGTANNPTKGVGAQTVKIDGSKYTVNGARAHTSTTLIELGTSSYKSALVAEMADGFSVEAGFVIPYGVDNSRERYIFGGTSGGGFGLRVGKSGNLEFILSCTKNYDTLSLGQVSFEEYHHVVVTYDKTAQTITAYLDGAAVTPSLTGMPQFNAGGWNGNIMLFDTSSTQKGYQYNLPMNTIVTDFHLYADPLTAAESTEKYTAALDEMTLAAALVNQTAIQIPTNQQATYTANLVYNGTDPVSLEIAGIELLNISSSGIKLCGKGVAGTYGAGTYGVKAIVNKVQNMTYLEITLPDGGVIRRGAGSLIYSDLTSGLDFVSVYSKNTNCVADPQPQIAYTAASVNEYTLKNDEPQYIGFEANVFNVVSSFGNAETDRFFNWTALSSFIGTEGEMALYYRKSTDSSWTEAKATRRVEKTTIADEDFFFVDLTGLTADTTYEYYIGKVGASANTADGGSVHSFKTAAKNIKSFDFIAIGDTQGVSWAGETTATSGADGKGFKFAEAAFREAFEAAPDAAFVLHTGDVTESGKLTEQYNYYFKAFGNEAYSIPHFAAAGNHDMYSIDNANEDFLFNYHFNHPNNGGASAFVQPATLPANLRCATIFKSPGETAYSFNYGNAHFVVYNTGVYDNYTTGGDAARVGDQAVQEAQRAWLQADLEANKDAQWTILLAHEPAYHRLGGAEDSAWLADLIEEYVDLAILGHEHLVTRTYPIKDGEIVTKESPYLIQQGTGTVYNTIGSTTLNHEGINDAQTVENHMLVEIPEQKQASYSVVNVSEEGITVTIRQLNGFVLDSYTIEAMQPTGIEILSQPDKLEYVVGETLDLTGGTIKATYADNSTRTIDMTDDMITGFDSSTAGAQQVTVTYGGKTAQFSVTVSAPLIGDINGDDKIDTADVVRLKKYFAAYNYKTGISSQEIEEANADCNGDGEINIKDVVRLKKYLANRDPQTNISTVPLGKVD